PGLHDQQPEPGGGLAVGDAADRTGGHAVYLRDPALRPARVTGPPGRVLADDLRAEPLEAGVPADLAAVHGAVPLQDPAEAAGRERAQRDRSLRRVAVAGGPLLLPERLG